MSKVEIQKSLLLVLATAIWGSAFVAQSVGMNYITPFAFSASRFLLGGLVLLPCIAFGDRHEKRSERAAGWRKALPGGILCGIFLAAAADLQQVGIQFTTVGRAGFITAMYIVFVPVLEIFLRKKPGIKTFVSVFIALAGLYLLNSMEGEGLAFGIGEACMLLCAVCFAFQILAVDHFSSCTDCLKLACIQFLTCSLLSAVLMVLFEDVTRAAVLSAAVPILYTGVLSCGVAYTLQIVAQKDLSPMTASLIFSLESVFSALSGWLILHQTLSRRELAGCLLIFAAILIAQLPSRRSAHPAAGESPDRKSL